MKRQRSPYAHSGPPPSSDLALNLLRRIAEVLVLAGVSHDEVRQLFDDASKVPRARKRTNTSSPKFNWWRFARVITVWHQHPDFTDHSGAPRELTIAGRSSAFAALISQTLPRSNARHVLNALLDLGAIRKTSRNTVIPIRRAFIVKQRSEMTLIRALETLNSLISTIHGNVIKSRAKRPGRGLFERAVVSERFDARHLRALDVLVRTNGQSFLEMLDEWLSRHEITGMNKEKPGTQVGVGVYLFADSQ